MSKVRLSLMIDAAFVVKIFSRNAGMTLNRQKGKQKRHCEEEMGNSAQSLVLNDHDLWY